ncbi:MAG: flagellar basal body-associated protein FliL [Azovibrio sp.]|nr:flagellar basal body-associated protein FliL [Azovibrio sp.]
MAKDANPVADEPPKKSKKLLIIIVIAVLVIGLAGAAAAFLLLSGKGEHEDGEEEVAAEVKKPKKKKDNAAPPVFVNLDAFTVNLAPEQGQGDQYMQVVIALELEDMSADGPLKNQMPRIRNNLTMILSSKKASELLTKEGKENLAEEIKTEINRIMNPGHKGTPPDSPVLSVLFTSFIIQ